MAAINQKFAVYRGDDIAPVFTVRNAAGVAIDISTVQNIEWIAYRNFTTSPLLKKMKTTGGIEFVTNGANGELRVLIDKIDTAALSWGWYYHSVVITDATGEITTVTTGRMAILERGMLV